MEAIILAGGLGTRLRCVIGEVPKCMAPVGGKPFLHYLFRYLEAQGCTRCILSLGYRHEAILSWLAASEPKFDVAWVLEPEPLGTGGGIRLALAAAVAETVFVLNGDTFFATDLKQLGAFHKRTSAETSLSLKALQDFDRYGTVATRSDGCIEAFEEKAPKAAGLINGGVYCIDRTAFLARPFPDRFSFEKDYLERYVTSGIFYGTTSDGYFIDIGVPADYERSQTEVPARVA